MSPANTSAANTSAKAEATANQRAATEPGQTIWLAANAGSGKTHVLTDRLARLLLNGVRPGSILCLTFTKAGAAEMKNRLFAKLAKWATCEEAELQTALTQLFGAPPATEVLPRARRLFAEVLDAPGGLRIQTIHGFCEGLLKRFPIEAGVPPQFKVADEAIAAVLVRRARDAMLNEAEKNETLGAALERLVAATSEDRFSKVLDALVKDRGKLLALRVVAGSIDAAVVQTYSNFGVDPSESPEGITSRHMRSVPEAAMRTAARALAGGTESYKKMAKHIADLLQDGQRERRFDDWASIFLTDKGTPRAKLANKDVADAHPQVVTDLQQEQDRVVVTVAAAEACRVAGLSAAALRVGDAFLGHYETEKRNHALLDYDDLIRTTRDLLLQEDIAPWVLYRLDAGLDHVLVDEAQDTSPEQWDVVYMLTDEFYRGESAREAVRNTFVVGDIKQSIFSFQGADPRAFLDYERLFRERALTSGEARWQRIELGVSFRSVPAVLEAVDQVFALEAAQAGVVEHERRVRHRAVRAEAPGLVELWPLMQTPKAADDEEPWDAPLDYSGSESAPVRLARKIATEIRGWLKSDEPLPFTGRPARPGDIMILVRRRDVLFDQIVRELKRANIPVAGADRMDLGAQLVVMDLLALAAFALQPEDDLNLATVLKGPLFQFSEERLFELAHDGKRRSGSLWQALRRRAPENADFTRAAEELTAILALADFVPPYEFFARILSDRGGRKRILARMGSEVAEAIDEFLDWALMDERESAPSLEGFVHRFRRGTSEIKRDLQQTRDEVRILTVHGAKGLEAPIVIMPDTCRTPSRQGEPPFFWVGAPAAAADALPRNQTPYLVWSGRTAIADAAKAEYRARRDDEYRRLLYVALTRARDRLHIAGWCGPKGADAGCWHQLVGAALEGMEGVEAIETEEGRLLRLKRDGRIERKSDKEEAERALTVPDWIGQPAPPEPEPARPLAPSRPDEEMPAALGPFATEASDRRRFQRGRLVHRLLQTLPDIPAEGRAPAAMRFMAAAARDWSDEERRGLIGEVIGLIDDPAFAAVFGPGSRAEAPITGHAGSRIISGTIDRLVVQGDDILIVDFKSNRPPPQSIAATDPAYLKQMAAYRHLLRTAHPGKQVRAALIWTNGPRMMEIPPDLLDEAARTIGITEK